MLLFHPSDNPRPGSVSRPTERFVGLKLRRRKHLCCTIYAGAQG